jgi:HNH endonuclease
LIDELSGEKRRREAGDGIDDPKNGILLQATLHKLWDALLLSYHYVPALLHLSYRQDSDTLVFWTHTGMEAFDKLNGGPMKIPRDVTGPPKTFFDIHFASCVWANMKGAGEPVDPDFNPDTDDTSTVPSDAPSDVKPIPPIGQLDAPKSAPPQSNPPSDPSKSDHPQFKPDITESAPDSPAKSKSTLDQTPWKKSSTTGVNLPSTPLTKVTALQPGTPAGGE